MPRYEPTAEPPRVLEVPRGEGAREALPALRRMLDGQGPLLLPCAPDRPFTAPNPTPGGTPCGVAVGTSGSTGTAKRAVLTSAALRASIDATHHRLGGSGRWLLAIPGHHIAGLQVLLRSLRAGEEPGYVAAGQFTPAAFVAAARLMTAAERWYTSVVPVQLDDLLADADAVSLLRTCAGVLCGAAAVPEPLRRRAADAGIRVVATYGMSETAGGCVYDGVPLDGVSVRVGPGDGGRIHLAGRMLAQGYLGDAEASAAAFVQEPQGRRWFASGDAGSLAADGTLAVHGRLDDVVITGGYKVRPGVVEDALRTVLPGGTQVAVVGVPDRHWGQALVAAVTLRDGGCSGTDRPSVRELRDLLREQLPGYALPHHLAYLPALPTIGPGKVDRVRLVKMLIRAGVQE